MSNPQQERENQLTELKAKKAALTTKYKSIITFFQEASEEERGTYGQLEKQIKSLETYIETTKLNLELPYDYGSIVDAMMGLRVDIISCLYPLFSSQRNPVSNVTRENSRFTVNIVSNPLYGRPTVNDQRLMVYIISQAIQEANNNNGKVPQTISFSIADYLKTFNIEAAGDTRKLAKEGIQRIYGTSISVVTKSGKRLDQGLAPFFDSVNIIHSEHFKGTEIFDATHYAVTGFEITLHRWLHEKLQNKEIQKLPPAYIAWSPFKKNLFSYAAAFLGNDTTKTVSEQVIVQSCDFAPIDDNTLPAKEKAKVYSDYLREFRRNLKKCAHPDDEIKIEAVQGTKMFRITRLTAKKIYEPKKDE